MKRVLLLMLALLAVSICARAEASTMVMVYMSGDTLESEDGGGSADLNEMIHAMQSGSDSVRVLAMTGGCSKWQMKAISSEAVSIHEIDEDGLHTLAQLPKTSMGDPDTLAQFLSFGLREEADRYVLVLWGHGDGPTGGVCSDPLFRGDTLMPEELTQALSASLSIGQKLDAVVFDACVMGSLEIAQSIQSQASYMVASQEMTVGTGMRYDRWLQALIQDPDMETQQLCTAIAQTYVDDNNFGRFGQTCAISVLDLRRTDAVTQAAERLYGALLKRLESQPGDVFDRRGALKSFGEFDGSGATDQVDALLIAEAFEDLEPASCRALCEAVKRMVVFNVSSDDMVEYANGLSLMMPYATGAWANLVLQWYGPRAEDSDYAALIVEMESRVKENAPTPAVPREEMWTGLLDSASQPRDAAKLPDPAQMWEGLTDAR